MPVFKVIRTTESEAFIEAPTAEQAVAEAKTWSRFDWSDENEDVYSVGTTKERPDFTVDLRGQAHEHDFDDEDTGGCIYCDEPNPADQAGENHATPPEGGSL